MCPRKRLLGYTSLRGSSKKNKRAKVDVAAHVTSQTGKEPAPEGVVTRVATVLALVAPWRHWVITAFVPGVAFEDSPHGERAAPAQSVLVDRLPGVF